MCHPFSLPDLEIPLPPAPATISDDFRNMPGGKSAEDRSTELRFPAVCGDDLANSAEISFRLIEKRATWRVEQADEKQSTEKSLKFPSDGQCPGRGPMDDIRWGEIGHGRDPMSPIEHMDNSPSAMSGRSRELHQASPMVGPRDTRGSPPSESADALHKKNSKKQGCQGLFKIPRP